MERKTEENIPGNSGKRDKKKLILLKSVNSLLNTVNGDIYKLEEDGSLNLLGLNLTEVDFSYLQLLDKEDTETVLCCAFDLGLLGIGGNSDEGKTLPDA